MQPKSDAPSGASVAVATLIGFFAVTIFAAAVGGYIGRHSTPEPVDAAAEPSSAPPAAPAANPAPGAAPAETIPETGQTPVAPVNP